MKVNENWTHYMGHVVGTGNNLFVCLEYGRVRVLLEKGTAVAVTLVHRVLHPVRTPANCTASRNSMHCF